MEGIPEWQRDVLINLACTLLGAVLLYVISEGKNLTKAAQKRARKSFVEKVAQFKESDPMGKQVITFDYYFSAFRIYIIGNIFWVAQGSAYLLEITGSSAVAYIVSLVATILGMICFFVAMARLMRLQKIKAAAE